MLTYALGSNYDDSSICLCTKRLINCKMIPYFLQIGFRMRERLMLCKRGTNFSAGAIDEYSLHGSNGYMTSLPLLLQNYTPPGNKQITKLRNSNDD
jgi:hypothetical protein